MAKFLSQFEQPCTLSWNERWLFLLKQIGISHMFFFKVGWGKRSCCFFLWELHCVWIVHITVHRSRTLSFLIPCPSSTGIFPQDIPEDVSTDEDDDEFGRRKRKKKAVKPWQQNELEKVKGKASSAFGKETICSDLCSLAKCQIPALLRKATLLFRIFRMCLVWWGLNVQLSSLWKWGEFSYQFWGKHHLKNFSQKQNWKQLFALLL